MAYALFASSKLSVDSQINSVNLQQTQRGNEQYALATQNAGLSQDLTSLSVAQAEELSDLYEVLANSNEDGLIAEFTNNLDQDTFDSFTTDAQDLINKNASRAQINAKIEELELKFEIEADKINRKIYEIGIKENAVEMEVKRLDTKITALQKQLEKIEEAESSAIERSTPSFKGVG